MTYLNVLVVDALRAAHAVSDDRHDAVRRFRNVLIVATALSTLLVVAVVLLGAKWPSLIPVCGEKICPSGRSSPTGGDVGLVALFGGIGAALAVLSTLSDIKIPEMPYSLNGPQLLLKIPAGALTGLVALIVLQAAIIENFTPPASQAALLFYATAFGYAQQVATRLVDAKATDVLTAARPSSSSP